MPFGQIILTAAKPTPYPAELRILGDHLKKRRLELGLRQKDVAVQLGVNEFAMADWENNKTTPMIRYMPRIIEFLGYDPYRMPQTFGEKLAAYRRQHGLTRLRLAGRLSVHPDTVSRWESGVTQPTGRRLAHIEEALRTSGCS